MPKRKTFDNEELINRQLSLAENLYIISQNYDKCTVALQGTYVLYTNYIMNDVVQAINQQNISDDEKYLLERVAEGIVVYFQNNLFNVLKSCSSSRYAAIPLFIKTRVSHWNLLIFDQQNKTVERFEPHHTSTSYKDIDTHLELIFQQHGYAYKSSNTFCPLGPQYFESNQVLQETQNCGFWGLMYLELKLQSRDTSQKNVLDQISQLVKERGAHTVIKEFKEDVLRYIHKNSKYINHFKKTIEQDYQNLRKQTKYYTTSSNYYFRYEFPGIMHGKKYHRYLSYNGTDTIFDEEPSFKKYIICKQHTDLQQLQATCHLLNNKYQILFHSSGDITLASNESLDNVYEYIKIQCKVR